MSTDPRAAHCPRCYAPLRRAESPEGLCPKCLLAVGMGEDAVIRTHTGAPVPAPPSLDELRPHFAGLDVLSLIGRGGAGAVYRAIQRDLGRQVALKVLLLDPEVDPTFGERFVREARAMASLAHPNIAAVHDAGRAGPYWYLVMEFIDGPNLRQLIQSRDLAPSEALDVVRQICDALEYAHGEGVVHRDIKPENVLVDARGRVKLVDFGLAKLLGEGRLAGGASLTHSSQAMGTWHYMAPEQMRRPLEVDHRADIYSLGVVLYELLTGEVPQGRYAPVSERSRADHRVDAIVDRALEQDPSRRYQAASGVRDDVVRVQAGPELEPAPGPESSPAAGPSEKHQRRARRDERTPGEPAPAPARGRSWLHSCLLLLLVVFVLMVVGALTLTAWVAPSGQPSGTSSSAPTERASGPSQLLAVVQSVYPDIDITDPVLGSWSQYRTLERKHIDTAAFRTRDGSWVQVDIRPFERERDALIEGMLTRIDPGGSPLRRADARAAIEESATLPSGKELLTFELAGVGKRTVDVFRNDEPLERGMTLRATSDPVLHPVMRQAPSSARFAEQLAAAEQLPWSKDELGVGHAPIPAYRALASWWREHLELEDEHTTMRFESEPAAVVFEVEPFVDVIERRRGALRDAMVAEIGPQAWGELERQIAWRDLAPLGRVAADSVRVVAGRGGPAVTLQSGEAAVRSFIGTWPWNLSRFVARYEPFAPLGPSLGQGQDGVLFDLNRAWPGATDALSSADEAAIREIASAYRVLESAAYAETKNLRAAGGRQRSSGWPLSSPPPERACIAFATIQSFAPERAALEDALRTRLGSAASAIDLAVLDGLVDAVLPFGERTVALTRDRVGDLQALIAVDEGSGDAELAWLGRELDWRAQRFFTATDGPIRFDTAGVPCACLTQTLVDAAPEWVLAGGAAGRLDVRVPGEGAALLLSGMPEPLKADRAAVELAEASWLEFTELLRANVRWTWWNSVQGSSWSQVDVEAFPKERAAWLARSIARAEAHELSAAFTASLMGADDDLPGSVARAELYLPAPSDPIRVQVVEGARARSRAVFVALEAAISELSPPEAASDFDRPVVDAVWPFPSVPPPASVTESILAIRAEYLSLERDAVTAYHDVSGYGELELRVAPFPADRARLIEALRALRQSAKDERGGLTVRPDASTYVVPFGGAPGAIHCALRGGKANIERVDWPEGTTQRPPLAHLCDASQITEAQLFCDPAELGLPADLPPAARWAVAAARRRYLFSLDQVVLVVEAEAPPFPRPPGSVRRLADEGDVIRFPAIPAEIQRLYSELERDLADLGVTIVDAAVLRSELFRVGDVAVDIAVRESPGGVKVEIELTESTDNALPESSRIQTVFQGETLDWRWAPIFPH